MKYIIKFSDFSCVTDISNKYKLRVLRILKNLSMIIFDYDSSLDEINFTKLRNEGCIQYIQCDEIISLDDDYETTILEVSKKKVTDQQLTLAGNFSSGQEYYGHLELLNSVDYSNVVHDFSTTKTGDGVDIFIFDSGVNFNHPRLVDRVFRVPNFDLNLDGIGDDDNDGHGTMSALMASGLLCGVARDSRIYSLKVLGGPDTTGSSIDISYAIDSLITFTETSDRPSIANFSLGSFPTTKSPFVGKDETGEDNYLLDGLKELAHRGVHVTAAAGNGFYDWDSNDEKFVKGPMMSTIRTGKINLSPEETNNNDPGQGKVIVVGATQTRSESLFPQSNPNKMATFSNYGRGNTINTPGQNILAPKWNWGKLGGNLSTYSVYNGTSFASPIIAGLLALRLEDKPNETPEETKQWLKDSARRGNIVNLSKENVIEGVKLFKWNSETQKLTIVISESAGIKFTDFLKESEGIFQYKINDTAISLPIYLEWKSTIYDHNDGWWEWTQSGVSDYSLELESRLGLPINEINGTPIVFTGSSFDIGISEDLLCTNLNNTHEVTDGVKLWQKESSSNKLFGWAGKIYDVEYTENLCAFNPYQTYQFNYESDIKPKIILPDAFYESPLKVAKFYTSRNESPIPTQIKIEGLTGINVTEDGEFIPIDFNTSINSENLLPSTIQVEYTNGYASFSDTLEVINNTTPPNILTNVRNYIWYGFQNNTDPFDLTSEQNIELVYQIENTNEGSRVVVYSKNLPNFIPQPFTELCAGYGYYVVLKSSDGINPDSTVTIPNAILSSNDSRNLLMS